VSKRLAVPFASMLLLGALVSAPPGVAAAEPGRCDDPYYVEFVVDLFEMVQEDNNGPRRMKSVGQIKEVRLATHPRTKDRQFDVSRFCRAVGTLDNGEAIPVWYRIYARKDGKGREDEGFRPCFGKYHAYSNVDCTQNEAAKL
jgi:hypothetical protein